MKCIKRKKRIFKKMDNECFNKIFDEILRGLFVASEEKLNLQDIMKIIFERFPNLMEFLGYENNQAFFHECQQGIVKCLQNIEHFKPIKSGRRSKAYLIGFNTQKIDFLLNKYNTTSDLNTLITFSSDIVPLFNVSNFFLVSFRIHWKKKRKY